MHYKLLKDKINDTILLKGIIYAINKVFEKDSILLENDTHEQGFSHKIACYLTSYMSDYLDENKLSVDCEYNKVGKDSKEFKSIMSEFIRGEYIIKDKNGKLICEHGKIILKSNNYTLSLIEGLGDIVIGKIEGVNNLIIESKGIRPDIIIHERGNNNNNLCIFEIKKGILSEKDILKLRGFTSEKLNFGYEYGIGLSDFDITKKTVKIDLFINGEKKHSELFSLNQNKDISLDESLNEALEGECFNIAF